MRIIPKHRNPTEFPTRSYASFIYIVVILAGALLTTLFHFREKYHERKWIEQNFQKEFGEHIGVLRQEIDHHFEGIGALTSFYRSSQVVERQEFNTFCGEILARHPNVLAYLWAPRVTDGERIAFEEAAKKDVPAFQINEMVAPKTFQKAARRPEYFPVFYMAYSRGSEKLIGFDLSSNPTRRQGLEKARDTGKLAATNRTELLDNVSKGYGFLLVAPIYTPGMPVATVSQRRQALKGFILNVCDINNFVSKALNTLNDEGLDISIRDLTAPPEIQDLCLVKSAKNQSMNPGAYAGWLPTGKEIIDVADHRWEICGIATPYFIAINKRVDLWAELFFGGLLTVALALYIYFLRGRILDAQRHSAEMDRSQKELKESRERLAGIINTAGEAIISIDERRDIILFNRGAENCFGFKAGYVIGRTLDALFAPHSIPDLHAILNDSAEAAAEHADFSRIIYGLRRDGAEFPLEASASRLMMDGAMITTLILRDKSEQVRLENQLRQSQKMEAIGQLAGGVAHDFNNILTVIIGNASVLLNRLDPADPHYGLIVEVQEAGMRASAVTHQLLAFSRKQFVKVVTLDLNRVIGEMSKVLNRLIGEQIQLSASLAANLWPIRADAGQIDQVIVNLVVNARDAMEGGGAIRVRTRNVTLEDPLHKLHGSLKPGQYVMLSVKDEGCGMDEETIAHIFEPFFTTKENGRGTGLGLSTVYGIVKRLGGLIAVNSARGSGTSFDIYIPRAEAEMPLRPPANGHRKSGTLDHATVLLAEDEEMLRNFIRSVLERAGMSVLIAGDGEEALKISKSHGGLIDLLLTDVVMPKLSGDQLAGEITRLRPQTKILFMSGYAKNVKTGEALEFDPSVFIAKPFTPEELTDKIQKILHPPAPAITQ